MQEIILRNVSPGRLLMLGDTALKSRDIDLAIGLYAAALKADNGSLELRLRNRLGLARNPNGRTLTMLDALQVLDGMEGIFLGEGLATWNKTLPFMDDEKFKALADKHSDLLPIANWQWNLQTVCWAVKRARDLPGDLVELGVFKGHTTLFVAEYLDFAGWDKTWHLYDTFDGIPDDQLDEGWKERNDDLYRGMFSFEEVRDRFAHIPNIDVIQGRVPEILHERCPDQVSFLHIDLNNVTAEIAALDFIYERVAPGGCLIFDDYAWATARPQYEAENAWFAARGLQILALPTGQGLLVKPA
jgi:hypothetical protein